MVLLVPFCYWVWSFSQIAEIGVPGEPAFNPLNCKKFLIPSDQTFSHCWETVFQLPHLQQISSES